MRLRVLTTTILILIAVANAAAQITAFTYQGKLNDGGVPANGTYDLAFRLFDEFNGGAQVGATVTKQNVQVVNGIFTVLLDFGDEFGAPLRYLEVGVAPVGSGNFTTLAPRQLISSTPYSVRTQIAVNSSNADKLGGVPANQYVVTTDPRMTDERDPKPGSSNYIRNNELAPQNGGFNISGNGTVGGNLNVGGTLTADGSGLTALNASNLTSGFVPVERGGTGLFSPGAAGNFLRSTGNAWTSSPIGLSDLPDLSPNFIKNSNLVQPGANFNVGGDGTIGGFLLVGNSATVIGSFDAGFNGTFGGTVSATYVNAANSFMLNNFPILSSPGNNLFAGIGTGVNNLTGTYNSYFGTQAGSFNASGSNNSFFGYLSGKQNSAGSDNSFFGSVAGFTNNGDNNSFFGSNAGYLNQNGANNSFFGQNAGSSNTTQSYNSFFGTSAGQFSEAGFNSFFGYRAGFVSTGSDNAFFGTYSGQSNGIGTRNVFVGFSAGNDNVTGNDNTLVGYKAGFSNTGSRNTLVGSGTTANGTRNTLIGAGALVLPTNLSNATAVGADSMVTGNDSLVLGSVNGANGATATVRVGIGTTQPVERLDVRGGNVYVGSAGQGMILKSPNGAVCILLTVSNAGALVTTAVACP